MRAWLAICALAMAGCSAQPDAEAQQATSPSDTNIHAQNTQLIYSNPEFLEQVYKHAPELRGRSDECLNGYLNNRGKRLRIAFGNEEGEIDTRSNEALLKDIPACNIMTTQASNDESLPEYVTVQKMPRLGETLTCHGVVKQGGLVVCQTQPNARVEVGRSENDTYTQTADKDGVLLVGFDRDEPAAFVRVGEQHVDFDIQKRDYDISRIDGLPKNMVSEYTTEELARIRKASALKKVGFASMVEEVGFKNGFIYPVTTHTKTTNFGAQRILNGEPKRPHFGVDLAAPKGTPILAPADGIVSLASTEMYFEGSLIMIDHGQGLISYYLHNETVDVEDGQRVTQGQQIGTVGSRGRSTGPHLCWRLKWRGRNLDPELLTEWPSNG